jgi:hypothetical protein
VAIGAHLLHNLFLNLGDLCLLSFAFDWIGVFVIGVVSVIAWRMERRIIREQLAAEVEADVLTDEHLQMILSRGHRNGDHLDPGGSTSVEEATLRRELLRDGVELAFQKQQRTAEEDQGVHQRAIADLRRRIFRLRMRLGDESLFYSETCPTCGRPSRADTDICSYCGANWRDDSRS